MYLTKEVAAQASARSVSKAVNAMGFSSSEPITLKISYGDPEDGYFFETVIHDCLKDQTLWIKGSVLKTIDNKPLVEINISDRSAETVYNFFIIGEEILPVGSMHNKRALS